MTKKQLKEAIAALLPSWVVTIDEAYMVNISADQIAADKGFIYIEEFNTAIVDFTRYGKRVRENFEVYFCRFADFECNAETREDIREESIMPAVNIVENYLRSQNITMINRDLYPRGFDANEVLVHIAFQAEEIPC